MKAEILQKLYYKRMADSYDAMHVGVFDEHDFALSILSSLISLYGFNSIIDVGAGTGRCYRFLRDKHPNLKITGVEPVEELRQVAIKNGVPEDSIVEGDGYSLKFDEGEFDLVCSFGVLHHVEKPRQVVAEMLRVAKRAVFISDSNNFGQGSASVRFIKNILRLTRMWPLFNLMKTKGKGYSINEGDGLSYSYSVFNDFAYLKANSKEVRLFGTKDSSVNLLYTASHAAVLALK